MHLGVILPNFGPGSSPAGIREFAEAAEEAGYDSIWTTEHFVVGPDAPEIYRRMYDSLLTLAWLAALTERIALGTSILLLPLRDPFRLARETTTLQELSGGRLTVGVGLGSQESEFELMGVPLRGRGRRADETIRLLRKLWAGDLPGALAEPHPAPVPEVWVGGSSDRAVRRALELGDVWHPSGGSDPDQVRAVKERHPELRIVPRTSPDRLDAMLDAGAEGAVLTFSGVDELRDVARRYR